MVWCMSIFGQVRHFVRAFIRFRPGPPQRHRGHAIARTIKRGTTIIGGNVNGSLGNIGHSQREDMMVEASERYDDSLEKE